LLVTRSGTVLLVEDEAPIRELCATFLGNLGYEVLVAEDGRAGLDLYVRERKRIDLIITDMRMPQMSGADLIGAVDTLGERPPILVMTGYSPDLATISIPELTVLSKPFRLSELGAAAARLIEAATPRTRGPGGG